MNEFSSRQQHFFIPFDLNKEERSLFDRYFRFLDDSGVAAVIKKHEKNHSSKGGRPNVNFFNLFAAILFGFSSGCTTLRELEDACSHDIRYIDMMEQIRPSYVTISNFINNVIAPNEDIIFSLINKQIVKDLSVDLDDAFIDGTKWEANANKYKFVWKPVKYHENISVSFFRILKENNLCADFREERMVRSSTITKAIDAFENEKSRFQEKQYNAVAKSLSAILVKVLEYEEKERICGENRKSYFKTDHDATAMSLKADYYSGLGSNMHAAYNVQSLVINGIVLSYYVSQSRTDIADFIPVLEHFHKLYSVYPKNICADSGYGSLENYTFLKDHGIGNYVKPQSWEGNVTGSYPESYRLQNDGTIVCLNQHIGTRVEIPWRHPKKAGGVFFKIDGCTDCPYKKYCMRWMKDIDDQTEKIFEVNVKLAELKQEAEKNLLSLKGIEIRVNRSIQVEGVFGIEKQDYRYTRTRRRGLEKVSTEMMLMFLGLNIKRLLKYYQTGKKLSFWKAPSDLEPESFKNPSAKRLSRKGEKLHDNLYK